MGLNDNEVIKSRTLYGTNEITKVKKNTFIRLLIESLETQLLKFF